MALTIPVSEIVEKNSNRLLGKHESWGRVLLGNVATVLNGFAFKSAEFSSSDGVPLIRIRDVGKDCSETTYLGDYDARYIVEPGDLLVGMDGDFNCARWRGPRGLLNQRVCKVTLKSDIYLPKFLDYTLPGYLKAINDVTSSVTVKHLSSKTIEEIPLPLPPIEVQQRLVAEIEKQFSRLDEAVSNLKRVKANLKRYKAAVLKAAVEGKLTEDWRKQHPNVEPASKLLERILAERRAQWSGRGKYKEPVAADAADLPPLPSNWKWVSLDQVLLNITDGDHQPPPQTDSGVPFLVIGNVRSGRLDFEGTRFVSQQYANEVDVFRKPTRGDILYTLVGSFGIALRVDTDREFCIQRHIGILRPHKLSPASYLVHVLNSSFVFNQASNVATGTAQKTVPLSGLRRFAIPLAPPVEQQQIVADVEHRLSTIEELEAAVEANLTRADRLRQSVLQLAFSGRLKVTEVAATLDLSPLGIATQPNAPYISTEEILMNKRPTTSSGHRRTLLDALEEMDSPVAPEELFSLCGFDSTSIEQVERFYVELNELISASKVEELRPTQDRVTLKVIQ